MEAAARTEIPTLRPVVRNHLVIVVALVTWRGIENTPGLASVTGGTFAASTAGRALALIAVLASVVALLAIVISTLRARRDARAWLLFAALAAALLQRRTIDVFDIVYVALVAIAAALVFTTRRS